MQTLAPIFHGPEYERPQDGCEIQVRWSDFVATARSSSVTSETPVFSNSHRFQAACLFSV